MVTSHLSFLCNCFCLHSIHINLIIANRTLDTPLRSLLSVLPPSLQSTRSAAPRGSEDRTNMQRPWVFNVSHELMPQVHALMFVAFSVLKDLEGNPNGDLAWGWFHQNTWFNTSWSVEGFTSFAIWIDSFKLQSLPNDLISPMNHFGPG